MTWRHPDRNFSGFTGIEREDAVIAVSTGPIVAGTLFRGRGRAL